jgi:hypothetical protein
VLQERPAAEPEEVVRLAEMRDARPLPPVEDEVGIAVRAARRVTLEHMDAAAASRETDRRRQPREPASEDRHVGPDRPPGHDRHHAQVPAGRQARRRSGADRLASAP